MPKVVSVSERRVAAEAISTFVRAKERRTARGGSELLDGPGWPGIPYPAEWASA